MLACICAQVAEVAAWVLFMWLFALSAYDALSGAPDLAWGTPLVVAGVYLVLFTLYQGYKDYSELQQDMKETDKECHDADLGGQDGDGVDEGGADNPEAGTAEQPPVLLAEDETESMVGGCIDCNVPEEDIDPETTRRRTEIAIHEDDPESGDSSPVSETTQAPQAQARAPQTEAGAASPTAEASQAPRAQAQAPQAQASFRGLATRVGEMLALGPREG